MGSFGRVVACSTAPKTATATALTTALMKAKATGQPPV